jgi:hypothetical protein
MSEKDKSAGLFDHLKQVKSKKDPDWWENLSESGKKSWSTFMINRFLSMKMEYVDIVNELQPYVQHMEDCDVWRLYMELFPKDGRFYKYIKGKKGSDFPDFLVKLVADHFSVSRKEAENYIKIYLSTQQRKEKLIDLLNAYATDENKIKKVKRMKVKQRQ